MGIKQKITRACRRAWRKQVPSAGFHPSVFIKFGPETGIRSAQQVMVVWERLQRTVEPSQGSSLC